METANKFTVWVYTPAGYISSTTEERALELIETSPGYGNYIFFYADLAPIEEEVNDVEALAQEPTH